MRKETGFVIIILAGVIVLAWAVPSLLPGGGSATGGTQGDRMERPVLKIALYPYIDDVNGDSNAALVAILEERYNRMYPDDSIQIAISDDYSTYFSESSDFLSVFSQDGPDIVEVEQTVLDNLIVEGYIRPFGPAPDSRESTIARELGAVVRPYGYVGVINGSVWFIPTWLCAHYDFVRSPADSGPEAGDLGGRGTLPDLYISAYASTYGNDPDLLRAASLSAASGEPDPVAIDLLAARLSECSSASGENRCLDGYYFENVSAMDDFGSGKTDRYTGYSEMLYWILSRYPETAVQNITISGTVYGSGAHQSPAWVDGFVMNRNTGPEKTEQALRFISFYNSPETKELIALSLDSHAGSEGRVPRYLLPASAGFYSLGNVSGDRYYQAFYPVIANMTPFPTGGLRGDTMDTVYCSVASALKCRGMDIDCTGCACSCRS